MSPKRTFIWTADNGQAFSKVKQALSSPPVLALFNPTIPLFCKPMPHVCIVLAMPSCQDHGGGQLRLVQCGSQFLTDAETQYATIELELLAVVWAILKCKFYLFGLQHLDLREGFSILLHTATWRAGKDLCIPDALSCSPTSRPTPEDELLSAETSIYVRSIVILQAVESISCPQAVEQEDLALEELQQAARSDPAYNELLQGVRQENLYADGDLVLYGARIVVPAALRRRVLARLHDSHRGAESTKRRARQAVYWPGIDSDITNIVRACELCQIMLPSQQQEPLLCDENPTKPFQSVSDDFFTAAGKFFLVYADRLSGWLAVVPYGSDTTSAATIRHFRHLFRDLGVPVHLRTDCGSQFTSWKFVIFLEHWGVRHYKSIPHYPQSNGHAEAAVKDIKHLILKVAPSGNIDCEAFDRGLLELRNTPNQARAESCDRRAAARVQDARTRYDERAQPLRPLVFGAEVRIQDPCTKRWDKLGTVRVSASHGTTRSGYQVAESGGRNRPFPPPNDVTSGQLYFGAGATYPCS
ncbi:uncharacterized protein LOC119568354 [Penaeus monodon]|uniref:uncharacterized protein LOC119568354 n=1 Tax=Penaeus monodon TaxID=6687 RepID=UPI0018A7A3EE|nr:uncharacterized protein LOC119568354 [Penaeus monodon]